MHKGLEGLCGHNKEGQGIYGTWGLHLQSLKEKSKLSVYPAGKNKMNLPECKLHFQGFA